MAYYLLTEGLLTWTEIEHIGLDDADLILRAHLVRLDHKRRASPKPARGGKR